MIRYTGEKNTLFPLLVKLIDARDNLSVQVHPDDDYAQLNGSDMGKTEMWYVLDAEPGAGILYGFKEAITKDEFKNAISTNILLDYLNFIECKKGDCFYIPSGTLHAIGKGLLIAEIQQNSDITYRVYDYNRKDAQGNTRELHIDKAIEVTDIQIAEGQSIPVDNNGILVECKYFTTERITVKENICLNVDKERFEILIVCEGKIKIDGITYKKGDTLFVPAYIGTVLISGNCVLLRTYI